MQITLFQQESREMLKWLNQNRRMLLELYRNQYVAYNANRLIPHSENLREVLDLAKASGEPFVIYLVPVKQLLFKFYPFVFVQLLVTIGSPTIV